MSGINYIISKAVRGTKQSVKSQAAARAWRAGLLRGRTISPQRRTIFSQNKPPSRHKTSSLLDTAGVGGKKSQSNRDTRNPNKINALPARETSKNINKSLEDKAVAASPYLAKALGIPAPAGAVKAATRLAIKVEKIRRKALLYGLPILLISLFLFFFMMFESSTFDPPPANNNTTPTTSETCNPAQFTGDAFGKTSVCTITVTYNGSADDITITDTILPGTERSEEHSS